MSSRKADIPATGQQSGALFGLKSHLSNAEARDADFQATTAASKHLASKPPDKVPSSAVDYGVPAIPAMWWALFSLWKTTLELLAVQPGNMIANLFAALLLAGFVGGVFLLFGKPLWPQRHAQMVVLRPIDTTATGSVRKACVEPCLPALFDLKLAPVRPSNEGRRGNQPSPHAVE